MVNPHNSVVHSIRQKQSDAQQLYIKDLTLDVASILLVHI